MTNKLLFIYCVKSDTNSVCDQKNYFESKGRKNSTSLLNGVSNDSQAKTRPMEEGHSK